MYWLFRYSLSQKGTKNGLETSRTFATLLADVNLRRQLLEVTNEGEFKDLVIKRARELVIVQQQSRSSAHIKLDGIPAIDSSETGFKVRNQNAIAYSILQSKSRSIQLTLFFRSVNVKKFCQFGQGIREDLCRRLPHYISDYVDGIIGPRTPQKVISTTLFLYFACLLPAIAFGVLNDHNTHGKIGKCFRIPVK